MVLFLLCQEFQGYETQAAEKSREEKWGEDIDSLAQQLPEKHKNLFFQLSRDDFSRKINKLKSALTKLSDDEIKVQLRKIIASIGDSHTNLRINSERIFPIKFYWFKEGLYAVTTTADHEKILHCKLVKINGKQAKASAIINDSDEIEYELYGFYNKLKIIEVPKGNVSKANAPEYYEILERKKLDIE